MIIIQLPVLFRVERSVQRDVGNLGGWTAGEGLRRPAVLQDERITAGGHGEEITPETAEERWGRERDDWLFGRYSLAEHSRQYRTFCHGCEY